MPYCPKCGVELDPYIKQCPLCSFPIPDTGELEPRNLSRESLLLNRYRLKKAEQKRRWREARPFIFITVLLTLTLLSIVFGVLDLYFYKELTWSRYVIAVNLAVVVSLFFLMGIIQSFTLNLTGTSLTIAGFLFFIDSFDNNVSWFWNLGLIICFNFILWILILRYLIIHSRRRGLNIPAYCIFSISIACVSIDVVQSLAVNQILELKWSIPVISALIPIGILFVLLHILLSPSVKDRIKRTFHI